MVWPRGGEQVAEVPAERPEATYSWRGEEPRATTEHALHHLVIAPIGSRLRALAMTRRSGVHPAY